MMIGAVMPILASCRGKRMLTLCCSRVNPDTGSQSSDKV
ncbi:hypothetical protein AMST5_00770 [freshwater sediment metagenome]|uniref:Uncharacterized protein n=1 Tax=freshwater sediment metagenome TaxID=556182 RepID=A0AA48LXH3_9ZZZZ